MVEVPDVLDHTLPEGAWKFDADVARVFDDMLERSIPQYPVMRDTCTRLARRYAESGSWIVDIGCSRGEAVAPLVRVLPACRFLLCDVSEPMLEAARERYAGNNAVVVKPLDLRQSFPHPPGKTSVVLSVLTLQFVPIEYRQRILLNAYRELAPGGALLLVEKVLGSGAELDAAMVDEYLEMKRRNGYSEEEIDRKRLSLEGVLVPVSARMNEDLLREAGFRHLDCFWRWLNFAGWLAVK